MANLGDRRLIAVVGVLAGLIGGTITAAVNYALQEKSREAAQLDLQRTEAYLNYWKTNTRWDEILSILGRITKESGAYTKEDTANSPVIDDFCFNLTVLSQADWPSTWPSDAKVRLEALCEEYFILRHEVSSSRDSIAVYGSDEVLASLAINQRAIYAAKGDTQEGPLAKIKARSYAELILAMRRDRIPSSVSLDDILAVICGTSVSCLGSSDNSYLKGSSSNSNN